MKKLLALIFATLLVATSVTAFAESTTDTEDEMSINDIQYALAPDAIARTKPMVFTAENGDTLNYRAYYSPAYSAKAGDEKAMLFLFLHGSGEKGDDNEAQIRGQKNIVNFLISADAERLLGHIPYVVVAPQCPKGTVTPESPKGAQWVDTAYSEGSYSIDEVPVSRPLGLVIEMLDSMVANDNIDGNNIVVSGVSMGGYGAWDLALRRPDLVKSLIPICGGGDPTKALLLADKRIWVFHCDGDTQVPVEGSREMVAALEAVGTDVKYTEFNKLAHNAWWPAATEVSDPTLLEWIIDGYEFKINLSASKGGKLESSAACATLFNNEVTFKATADEGYSLTKLTVNGKEVVATEENGVYSYVLSDIFANTAVEATFESDEESTATTETESSVSKPDGDNKKKSSLTPFIVAAGAVIAAAAAVFIIKKRKK